MDLDGGRYLPFIFSFLRIMRSPKAMAEGQFGDWRSDFLGPWRQ